MLAELPRGFESSDEYERADFARYYVGHDGTEYLVTLLRHDLRDTIKDHGFTPRYTMFSHYRYNDGAGWFWECYAAEDYSGYLDAQSDAAEERQQRGISVWSDPNNVFARCERCETMRPTYAAVADDPNSARLCQQCLTESAED